MESSSTMAHCVLVEQLLDRERENTRRWLQCSMDSMVDELFCKLKKNLTSALRDHRDDQPDTGSHHHYNLQRDDAYQKALLNLQAESLSIPFRETTFPQNITPNFSNRISLNTNSGPPVNINEPLVLIKEEIEEKTYGQSPNAKPTITSLSVSTENEKLFIHNSPSLDNNFHEEDDDEDCDCEDCLNGGIIKMEDECGDNRSDGELMHTENEHYHGEDASNAAKRQRIDAVQANNGDNTEQVITLSLQCLQPNCYQTFTNRKQLNDHMLLAHTIYRFRCMVKDCFQSFDNNLSQHLQTDHSHTRQWTCHHCTRHFKSYHILSMHTTNYHHRGQYKCAFSGCTFFREYKKDVLFHYKNQHVNQKMCQFSGCGQAFKSMTRLKAHERAHLGIEPYRCKWPGCCFSHASQENAMYHIRMSHFRRDGPYQNSIPSGDPKDYLEVVQELL